MQKISQALLTKLEINLNRLEYRKNEILKAICAFANVAGGMVIVGPNDKGFREELTKNINVLAQPKIDEVYKKIKSIWKEKRIRPKSLVSIAI